MTSASCSNFGLQHHVLAHGPVNLEKILEDFTQQQLVEDVECPK